MRQKIFLIVLILLSILAACNSQSPESSDDDSSTGDTSGATFNVTVSNAVDFSLTQENASSRLGIESPDGNDTATFWFGDGKGKVVSILFYNTAKPDSGEYEITPVTLTTDDDVVVGGLLIDGPDGETYIIAEGAITLTLEDDTYSGSFSFSVTHPLADEDAAPADVTGEFSGLSAK